MSGARTHGSLTNDEEVNGAAWAAGRGAVVGAAKVSTIQSIVVRPIKQSKSRRNGSFPAENLSHSHEHSNIRRNPPRKKD